MENYLNLLKFIFLTYNLHNKVKSIYVQKLKKGDRETKYLLGIYE